MTEVYFYRVASESPGQALLELLQEALEKGHRTVLRAKDSNHAEQLCDWLWTFGDGTFLPHGTAEDGFEENQPIYITADAEVPNNAIWILLAEGARLEPSEAGAFHRVSVLVSEHGRREARRVWKSFVAAGMLPVLLERDDTHNWKPADISPVNKSAESQKD